ncbi:MAG: hypothetical protein F6K31_31345 [Symploca sp. SIO2G7]|nr:hypothetical protein [Symploca sp. SIO2G7]
MAEDGETFTIGASDAAVTFFGLDNLGLGEVSIDPPAPRNFSPNMIKAFTSNNVGERTKAQRSRRPYTTYRKGGKNSNVQTSYSAPISANTRDALRTLFKKAHNAVKNKLGNYGYTKFVPEHYPIVLASIPDAAPAP